MSVTLLRSANAWRLLCMPC